MWNPAETAPKGPTIETAPNGPIILVRITRDVPKPRYGLARWETWEELRWFRSHKCSGWVGMHGSRFSEPFDEWMRIPD